MILTDDQADCLQEIINVAMGQASDQLAKYLSTFVHLQIPAIDQIDTEKLGRIINNEQKPAIISQGFLGSEGIRGEALLVYKMDDSERLTELLGYEPDELSLNEQLIDLSSILTTTFLNTLAAQMENQFSYSAPRLISDCSQIFAQHMKQLAAHSEIALKISIAYKVVDYSFECDMVLLIPELAIAKIQQVMDRILEAF